MITTLSILAFCVLLCVLTFSAVSLWLVIWPVRKFFGSLLTCFGPDPKTRILALGIVAIIFPATVSLALYEPMRLLASLFDILLESIYAVFDYLATSGSDGINETTIMEAIKRAAKPETAGAGHHFMTQCFATITGLFNSTLLVAIAAWVLVGQLLSQDERGHLPWLRIRGAFARMSSATRQNVLLFAVFASGSYLCVAAIVAAPWLQQYTVAALDETADLRKKLTELVGADQNLDRAFPESLRPEGDPVATLKTPEFTKQIEAIVDETVKGQLMNDIATFENLWTSIGESWKAERSKILGRRKQLIDVCLKAYEENTQDRLTSGERGEYARVLYAWANGELSENELMASYDRRNFEFGYSELNYWIDEVKRRLEVDPANPYIPTLRDMSPRVRDPISLLDDRQRLPPLPSGELELGPFGFFAAWLIKTRSLNLTLITGMIGFGVLGAASSSFIRQSRARGEGETLVLDLPGIVIRGVSAAIVVFLAAEGGLTVLASGDFEPNPYVLFFTCLVGAVYSENVWGWAGERLTNMLNRDDDVDEDAGSGGVTEDTSACETTTKPMERGSGSESLLGDEHGEHHAN